MFVNKIVLISGYLMFLILLRRRVVETACLGNSRGYCLNELTEQETQQSLTYALAKYEQAQLNITGDQINVSGKRITFEDDEELHIVFQYIDNTKHDIIQTCNIIIIHKPEQCEVLRLVCNPLPSATPRPLLKRDDLTVCNEYNEDDEEEEE